MTGGFEGIGVPVPSAARAFALAHLRELRPGLPLDVACDLVDDAAAQLEADRPRTAIALIGRVLDPAEAHQLVADLCSTTARRPPPPAAPRRRRRRRR